MKKSNKEKQKQKRENERSRRQEAERKKEKQIINVISTEQITSLRNFNISTFSEIEINREEMLECLHSLLIVIVNSSYLDEVTRMARGSISTEWFDREFDNELVEQILVKELEAAQNATTESIALKLCFWSNRIAHHLENEVVGKEKKFRMNELYLKYFLNPKYKYDLQDTRDAIKQGKDTDATRNLEDILIKEAVTLEEIRTPEQLNNLFLGLNIRNELWTLKQQMLKIILLNVAKNENSPVKVTALNDRKEVAINGGETLRLIIREIDGIAPVVMHCDKNQVDEFLLENNIPSIPEETQERIIRFAQNGKIGIHFVLDEEDREILEYEATDSPSAKRLRDIIYRGETEDDER